MDDTREHRSLLASAEERSLIAIARRLPPGLSSDHLTLLGLLSMPAAGLAFATIGTTSWARSGLASLQALRSEMLCVSVSLWR